MSIKIFFVDDERLLLESLSVFFSTDEEFEVVGSAASAEEALEYHIIDEIYQPRDKQAK